MVYLDSSRRARYFTIFAVVLVLLGVGVRVRHYLAAPSYWYDEADLLLNVFEKPCLELAGPLREDQAAPPLFLWTLRLLYLAAGPSECVMRLPAFAASLLAVGVLIPLSRRVVSGPGWLWAVGLGALSIHGVNHGIEVKPYAWDLLATLLLVRAATSYFSEGGSGRSAGAILVAVGAVAPWCSLPSVFVLGGIGAALLLNVCRRPTKGRLAICLIFNVICLLSSAVLYTCILRHQRTQVLEEYWADFFGDTSSVGGFLCWCITCLVGVGNYASNGLGVPLLLLGAAGAVLLGRRRPELAVLLTVPFALAMTASVLRFYPLTDRLTFFLVPCVWLLAAETVGRLAAYLCQPHRGRAAAWAGLVCLLVLLAPGAAQFSKKLFIVVPRLPFRDAFEYVEQRRDPQDICWVSHPDVMEVYRGKVPWCLRSHLPMPEVAKQAEGHRVWVIYAIGSSDRGELPDLDANLRQRGMKPLATQEFPSMLVRLYGPSPDGSLIAAAR